MIQFYVPDCEKLYSYGFIYKSGRYWWRRRRTMAMWVCEDSQRLTFQSPSRDCIAVVCQMYKDGALVIKEDCEEATFNMKVTEEEMHLIYERRKTQDLGEK